MNLPALRRPLHRQRVVVPERQRLLHHHAHSQPGTLLHNPPMLTGRREHQHRRRMRVGHHLRNAREMQTRRQMKLLCIRIKQRLVRFHDPHQLHIRPLQDRPRRYHRSPTQKRRHMPMHQSHNPYLQWSRCPRKSTSPAKHHNQRQHQSLLHASPRPEKISRYDNTLILPTTFPHTPIDTLRRLPESNVLKQTRQASRPVSVSDAIKRA